MTARILSTEEAVHRIVAGNHRDGSKTSMEVDVALIDMLQDGTAVATIDEGEVIRFRLTKGATR
jgi:hypothetical protein